MKRNDVFRRLLTSMSRGEGVSSVSTEEADYLQRLIALREALYGRPYGAGSGSGFMRDKMDLAREQFRELNFAIAQSFPGKDPPDVEVGAVTSVDQLPWDKCLHRLESALESPEDPRHPIAVELTRSLNYLRYLAGEAAVRSEQGTLPTDAPEEAPTASLGQAPYTDFDFDAAITLKKKRQDGKQAVLLNESLTPVLGTGVQQIGAHLDVIAVDPRLEQFAASRTGLSEFLRELVSSRLDGRRRTASEDDHAYVLVSFREQLLLAAFLANETLVTGWAATAKSHPNLGEAIPAVELDVLPEELRSALEGAIKATEEVALRAANLAPLRLLAAPSVGAGLIAIRDEVTGASGSGQPRLTSESVAWLCDSFWHSLIFGARVALRLDELVFQVRLVQDDRYNFPYSRPRKRWNPTNRIARRPFPDYVRQLSDSLNLVTEQGTRDTSERDGSPDPRDEFLRCLANVLVLEHELFCSNDPDNLANLPLSERLIADTRPTDRTPPAVALCMTADTHLEKALLESGRTFHVLAPFLIPLPKKPQRGHLQWFVTTVKSSPKAFGNTAWNEALLGTTWNTATKFEMNQIQGPIVIRANGTPFLGSPFPGAVPLVALGEFEFLQYVFLEQWLFARGQIDKKEGSLPRWVTETLSSSKRNWLWLGTRLKDWDSRTEFFLWFVRTGQSVHRHKHLAVVKDVDPDRRLLFDALGVELVDSELEELTDFLRVYNPRTWLQI